jgi:hypothetical protein
VKIKNHSIAAIAALMMVTAAPTVTAKKLHISFSGTSFSSSDADSDGDLQGGSRGSGVIKGSLGNGVYASQGDTDEWDGSTFCAFDDNNAPIAVELVYVSNSGVTTFENGDQLMSTLASSPPSTLCFNFVDGTSSFKIYRDIQGGTGRFEGATGTTEVTGTARPVDDGFSITQGTATSVLNLPKGK